MTRPRRSLAPATDTPMTDHARAVAAKAQATAPTNPLASFRTVAGPGYKLIHGDCADVLASIAPESVDAIVTDPPAGISFMGREWDGDKGGRDAWIAWLAGIMRRALVALKPGGHALVWALPRTSHWTATAVEDAGFEIRDVGIHLFGTGFPKSLDVSKAIDESLGNARGSSPDVRNGPDTNPGTKGDKYSGGFENATPRDAGAISPDAARFAGIGTALKPAAEHWILARKPLVGTVAANALQFGTGGLRIDDCRIAGPPSNGGTRSIAALGRMNDDGWQPRERTIDREMAAGRWPANVTLDEEAARALDLQSGTLTSGSTPTGERDGSQGAVYGASIGPRCLTPRDGSAGGASRFFYVAKAARTEKDAGLDHLPLRTGGEATDREEGSAGLSSPRAGTGRTGGVRNHHPTVKSIDLMRWLCRLVTPRGGVVLDLFAGSGTTGLAALAEGLRFVGIEREAEFVDIAAGRLAHATCQPTPERVAVDERPVERPAQRNLFDTLGAAP